MDPNQNTQSESLLISGAAEVFAPGNSPKQEGQPFNEVHARIGQQPLENDIPASALDSLQGPRRKR